jgi:hypothetical protein
MIVSVLDRTAGFFSMLFFSINHYIYCKRNNITFQLDTNDWLYKYKNGWEDYFQKISLKGKNEENIIKKVKHNEILGDYSIQEYRDVILNEFYLYNDELRRKIEEKKKLLPENYDSIYIRHGDKLCAESRYYPTEQYVDLLLEKNPNCSCIFVQTDDYNSVLDVENYIKKRDLNIQLIHFCDPQLKGVIAYETPLDLKFHNCIIKGDETHKEYFDKIIGELEKTKPLNKMDANEIRDHTIELLVGIDIVLNSNFCILDKQSNVSKFICIAHKQYKNVFDLRHPNDNVEMYWTMCPAFW